MADWDIQLFGEPNIHCHGKPWTKPESAIAQEIFLFLLSHRRTAHSRESLASLLWSECSTEQSKKNLRQTLWRLRSCDALPVEMKQTLLLAIDKDRIQLNPEIGFRIDTEQFEQIYREVKPRCVVDETMAQRLREAARLYRGEFLEGYWHDWCLFERERYQNMYLAMMDKLIEWCISQSEFEEGLDYCERILRLDSASERAHQQMMRLHHLSGNRTAALRQFERCVRHLKEELDVNPSAGTLAILAQIRADGVTQTYSNGNGVHSNGSGHIHANGNGHIHSNGNGHVYSNGSDTLLSHDLPLSLPQLSGRLRQFQMRLLELQKQIQKDIEMVEYLLPDQTE